MLNILQIIENCKRQQPASQKIFYEHFYGYALKIAFRYIYRYDAAVDITNDAFVKAFQHIGAFRCSAIDYPERLLMAWLKRIVINTAIDALRKEKEMHPMEAMPDWIWEKAEGSQYADNRLLYKELITLVKQLPQTYRLVFNMFVFDGCCHLEIADALRISVGASKSNLSRARSLLQQKIKEEDLLVPVLEYC